MDENLTTEKAPIVVSNPTIGQWKYSSVTIHKEGFCSISIGMTDVRCIDDLKAVQNLIETTIKAAQK